MLCTTCCGALQARRLESELDVKLAAYAKLCAGFEANFKLRTETSAGADQVSVDRHGGCSTVTARGVDVLS